MHDKTNHKMRVALAAGALLALGLAGCNREKAQMDTEPAAAATMRPIRISIQKRRTLPDSVCSAINRRHS